MWARCGARVSHQGGYWWAGRESNPHSRRRLIYSQRSSPPAQPTHGSRSTGGVLSTGWEDSNPARAGSTRGPLSGLWLDAVLELPGILGGIVVARRCGDQPVVADPPFLQTAPPPRPARAT